ncbi:hypothetical protein CCACVL1_23821, partial [Corchorus capsularis]
MGDSNSYDSAVSINSESWHWNASNECLLGALVVIIMVMALLFFKYSCSRLRPEIPIPPTHQYESDQKAEQVKNAVAEGDE